MKSFVLLTFLVAIVRGAIAAPVHADLAGQIDKLSDPDPGIRDQATRLLWAAGLEAQDVLNEATNDASPEAAGRARVILRNIEWGLLPDSPPEVFQLLTQYRDGGEAQRAAAYVRLSELGMRGIRVLLAIQRKEVRDKDRGLLLGALAKRSHESATGLIAVGDFKTADAVLKAASPANESATREYAAFLLLQGGLSEKVAELKASAAAATDGIAARQLVYFARAAGDLSTAASAAGQTAEIDLLDQILIEQEDWKGLASRYRSRVGDSESIETLGFAAAFSRLAGDAAALNAAVDAIKAASARDSGDFWKGAQILFLNDRFDDGMEVLLKRRDYLRAADMLLPHTDYKRVLELAVKGEGERFVGLPQLQARGAVALKFVGQRDVSRKTLDQLEAGARGDVAVWWSIIDARREVGGQAEAQRSLMKALQTERGNAALTLLGQGRLPENFPTVYWWEFFRRHAPADSPQATWKAVADLAAGRNKPEELDRMTDLSIREITDTSVPGATRNAALIALGQTMFTLGRNTAAERCFRAVAKGAVNPDPEILIRIGDCQMARNEFAAATDTYLAAWLRDRARPVPLVLRAAALLKSGKEPEAKESITLAHLLPLGNDAIRLELADTMKRVGFADDARKERDLTAVTGSFLSMPVCEFNRRAGNEASEKGEYLTAARFWEKAFLQNIKTRINFSVGWGNVAVPALIHKARAQGLIRSNDFAGAVREAERCRDDSPGDADAMIQLVTDFKSVGRTPEANTLFQSTRAVFGKLAEQYPDSGPAHNLLAWFEGKCGQELDDALVHAKKATDLEPNNTASLDTLAEVYFQRGDKANAIKAMNRCVELEPGDEHHQQQLARFGKAK